MFREGPALAAEFIDRHFILAAAFFAILFFDLPFVRQAVTVPARHIIRIVPGHLLRAGNEIFQDFVERMTDMDIAVGIRRAVMEHEFRPAPAVARMRR